MTAAAATIVIATTCGALALAAFCWFIVWPAWKAYTKTWERAAALFLSIYVLAGLVLLGAAGGALVAYYWDRIAA